MQWLDDAPDEWEEAPEHPPAASGTDEITTESLQNGITIREEEATGAYIYAQEDDLQEFA